MKFTKQIGLVALVLFSGNVCAEQSMFERTKDFFKTASKVIANKADNVFFHPKNNDPRLVGLTVTGCAMSLVGAHLLWKGLPRLIYGQKKSAGVNSPGRLAGLMGTLVGSSLLSGFTYLTLNAKDVVAQFDKWKAANS
jgi:hypothetical protein